MAPPSYRQLLRSEAQEPSWLSCLPHISYPIRWKVQAAPIPGLDLPRSLMVVLLLVPYSPPYIQQPE